MLGPEGDILSEPILPTVVDGSQTQMEESALEPSISAQMLTSQLNGIRVDTLPGLGSLGNDGKLTNSIQSDAQPSTGPNLAQNNIAFIVPRRVLQCTTCRNKHQPCNGESGKSCSACVQTQRNCSLLDRPFHCQYCNKDYPTDPHLRGHITRYHPRKPLRNPGILYQPRVTRNKSQEVITSSARDIHNTKPSKIRLKLQRVPSLPESAEPQGGILLNGVHSSLRVPMVQQQLPLHDPHPGTSRDVHTESTSSANVPSTTLNRYPKNPHINRPNKHYLSSGEPRTMVGGEDPDQSLQVMERPLPKPYRDLNFDVFEIYKKRKMSEDYIQRILNTVKDEIEQYGEFVTGLDNHTTIEVRERPRFLDEVTPLIHLREIDEEDKESFRIYFLQKSRLLMVLRDMFGVRPNTRLEKELEKFGQDVRLLKLPQLICGVLGHLILQLFTIKDPVREAELRFTEQSHGVDQAANTVQHTRLMAQDTHAFRNGLENDAKKLALSFYDVLRPLTHWKQDNLHYGSEEQHIERLRKIILDSLFLAAELEARMGTFSFFWPIPGEQFNPQLHIDEADDSNDERANDNRARQNQPITFTLMFGVTRTMGNDDVPLVYAKATVITMQPDVKVGF